MRAVWKLSGCLSLLALFGLSQVGLASAFTLERPVVTSHGTTERHACFRGGSEQSGDAVSVIDPAPCSAQRPRPEPLPVHRGGRVTIRTAEQAEQLRITVRSRAETRRLEAHPRDGSGRRWSFQMPRFKTGSDLGITIIYPDGQTSWSLPLRRHNHDPAMTSTDWDGWGTCTVDDSDRDRVCFVGQVGGPAGVLKAPKHARHGERFRFCVIRPNGNRHCTTDRTSGNRSATRFRATRAGTYKLRWRVAGETVARARLRERSPTL